MNSITKTLITINLVWIACCCFILFAGDHIPYELTDPDVKQFGYFLIAVSLPVSVIWTCVRIFNFKKPVVFIGPATLLSVLILTLAAFANSMCGTSTEVLYRNKYSSAEVIVRRSYGCGAYDSNLPEYKTYRIVPVNRFLNHVAKVDISQTDTMDWIKVK